MSDAPGTVDADTLDIQATLKRHILSGSTPVKGAAVAPKAAAPAQPAAPQPAQRAAPQATPPQAQKVAPELAGAMRAAIESNTIEVVEPPPEIIGLNSGTPPAAPAATPPAVPPDPPPQPQDTMVPEPPEVRTDPRAKHGWEILRKELREAKASIEAERQKAREAIKAVEEAKSAKSQRELELEQKLAEQDNLLGRYSLRATKEFQEKYVQPMNSKLTRAAQVLVSAGLDAEKAKATVIRMLKDGVTDDDFDGVLVNVPRHLQNVVSTAVFDAQEYERQAIEAESAWKQTKTALEADASKTQEVNLRKALVRETVTAAEELADKYDSWVFREDPGNAEWARQREKLILEAQHIMQNGSDSDVARYVLDGAAATIYRRYNDMLRSKVAALESELSARDAATPTPGSGGSSGFEAPKPPERPKSISLEEGLGLAFAMGKRQ